jgi:predicted patatin/cPLA2 family phospholipase
MPIDQISAEGLASALAKQSPPAAHKQGKKLEVLALSAGGKFGAYTAGILGGWQAHGTRPVFDVVTGASSGAIVAIYAFLGPHHDATVKRFFTETSSRDLYKWRPIRYLIHDGALATADPLKKIIEREVNTCVMDEVRAAHLAGRRLYVATLSYQAKRVVKWDLGAIACSGRPDADDIVRQILLAACAVPGMVAPVEFDIVVDGRHYKEKHSDGGAVTQTFIELGHHQAMVQHGTRWLEGSNLYILAAGKFFPDPSDADIGFVGRIGASVSASLYALYRAELYKLYAFCLVTGMTYNITAIDPKFVTDTKSMNINPESMRALYDHGYQQAVCGVPWRKVPPGGLLGEEEIPRAGTCFITIPRPAPLGPASSDPPRN